MNTTRPRVLLAALTLASTGLVACVGGDSTTGQEQNLTQAGDDVVPLKEGGQFEIFYEYTSDAVYHYEWRLVAANGEEILAGQVQTSKDLTLDAIELAAHAGQVEEAFRLSPAASNPDGLADGEWWFELVGYDQEVLGTSEVYASKSNAVRGMKTVMGTVPLATIDDWTDLCHHVLNELPEGVFVPGIVASDGTSFLYSDVDTAEGAAKERIRRALVLGGDRTSYVVRQLDNGNAHLDLVDGDGQVVLTSYYDYVAPEDAEIAAENLTRMYQELSGCELPAGS
jgi:uncharacterized protein YegP (UPF0339 family)